MRSPTCPQRLLEGLAPGGKQKLTTTHRYAEQHLGGLRRRSGENYALHGCEVAEALRELHADPVILAAAMLHDILLHPDGEQLLLRSPLTDDERTLVRRMHPLRRLHIDVNTDDLDAVIDAFTDDPRLLPLRMAHRLNDIRHLRRFSATDRHRIAHETLHMYSALAGRLGMHAWRSEMEDVCFRILQPRITQTLEAKLEAHRTLDRACMLHAKKFLSGKLQEAKIPCAVTTRMKGLYSMYRKMVLKRRRFEELTDRLAIRIVVRDRDECYRVLGVVHSALHPIPGKLKDYIGAPKENGYRSIHTVVYPLPGVTEQPIEIQIRTEDMHRECEYGIAHHGQYKDAVYALSSRNARVNLFRNLAALREETRTPRQFADALRTYFSDDHLALFDASNNLYHLRRPVSVLDFACAVHGQRCARLRGARVNGRERTLATLLYDGDTVDIHFGRKRTASSQWLAACRHNGSRKLVKILTQSSQ